MRIADPPHNHLQFTPPSSATQQIEKRFVHMFSTRLPLQQLPFLPFHQALRKHFFPPPLCARTYILQPSTQLSPSRLHAHIKSRGIYAPPDARDPTNRLASYCHFACSEREREKSSYACNTCALQRCRIRWASARLARLPILRLNIIFIFEQTSPQ